MPPLAWTAYTPGGELFDLSLADVHCDADWKWAKTIHFVLSAGWCGPCTNYARSLVDDAPPLRELGMEIVIIMVENQSGMTASSHYAYNHLKNTTPKVPTISAGDAETVLEGARWGGSRFLMYSGFALPFPTKFVVRTRDMKMIADASKTGPWAGKIMPLAKIAEDPEADWMP